MNTYGHTSALEQYVLHDATHELAVLADVGCRMSSWPPRASMHMVQVVDACWNTEDGSFFVQMYPVLS